MRAIRLKKLLIFLSFMGAATALADTSVTVKIEPIADRSGPIVVRVYDSKKTWLKKELLTKTVPLPDSDDIAVQFELQMAPGNYAIHVFQDIDNNGKMKTNFIGIPKEPTGVSNDAKGRFGPPKFKDAAVEVGDSPTSLAIRLTTI